MKLFKRRYDDVNKYIDQYNYCARSIFLDEQEIRRHPNSFYKNDLIKHILFSEKYLIKLAEKIDRMI
jgi:hypothetical protein